jgi:hypothetical protein
MSQIGQFNPDVIRVWCFLNSVYLLPTVELLEFLRQYVDDSCIEIGSGNNLLFQYLGIPGTDSFIQQTPEMVSYYTALGQVPTRPPSSVENLTAAEAIAKYRPKTVIAGWVTQYWNGKDSHGSVFGVDEEAVIDMGIRYIFVGARSEHSPKSILRRPHIEIPGTQHGVFSRVKDRGDDVIYLWNSGQAT